MTEIKKWNGKRYYPISQFYRSRFGERIQKISVNVAYTCPNREKGNRAGCLFCDEWGSVSNAQTKDLPVKDQIQLNKDRLMARFKARKFLVYFQSFTSTFTHFGKLEDNINQALSEPDIMGLIIGTRPDCLPDEVLDLFGRISEENFLAVELGIQSFSRTAIEFLRRGHSVEQSLEAIENLARKTRASVGVHLIFGIPGETDADIIQTARNINALPIHDVKLHNLHVLKNTGLHRLYQDGEFTPIDLEEYIRRVILFLEHLSPEIPIQRLAAYAGTHHNLVAPEWTGERLEPSNLIQRNLEELNTYQGRLVASAGEQLPAPPMVLQ